MGFVSKMYRGQICNLELETSSNMKNCMNGLERNMTDLNVFRHSDMSVQLSCSLKVEKRSSCEAFDIGNSRLVVFALALLLLELWLGLRHLLILLLLPLLPSHCHLKGTLQLFLRVMLGLQSAICASYHPCNEHAIVVPPGSISPHYTVPSAGTRAAPTRCSLPSPGVASRVWATQQIKLSLPLAALVLCGLRVFSSFFRKILNDRSQSQTSILSDCLHSTEPPDRAKAPGLHSAVLRPETQRRLDPPKRKGAWTARETH